MQGRHPNDVLHRLRGAEIEALQKWFPRGSRVLELGGGDGFQARVLTEFGCHVESIDVSPRADEAFFPVHRYDGERIPYADGTFDVTFSSNVLEHVVGLPRVLAELQRVCRPGALGVHLVPSTAWRFWTNGTHLPWLVSHVLARGGSAGSSKTNFQTAAVRNTPVQLAMKIVGLAPHGETGSSLSELYLFSRRRWRKLLTSQGFSVVHEGDNGLFYTGHMLLADLPIPVRRRLAKTLGGSCHVFVLKSAAA